MIIITERNLYLEGTTKPWPSFGVVAPLWLKVYVNLKTQFVSQEDEDDPCSLLENDDILVPWSLFLIKHNSIIYPKP